MCSPQRSSLTLTVAPAIHSRNPKWLCLHAAGLQDKPPDACAQGSGLLCQFLPLRHHLPGPWQHAREYQVARSAEFLFPSIHLPGDLLFNNCGLIKFATAEATSLSYACAMWREPRQRCAAHGFVFTMCCETVCGRQRSRRADPSKFSFERTPPRHCGGHQMWRPICHGFSTYAFHQVQLAAVHIPRTEGVLNGFKLIGQKE